MPVAKHGNRGITSRSGSADVLAALGVNIEADVPCVERCLDELGICFCFAPLLHAVDEARGRGPGEAGHAHDLQLLGPLTNPAAAPFQLLGVGRPELRPLLAEALVMLGTERALVVCGDDGLDEVTLAGATRVTEARKGSVREFTWRPEDFGLPAAGLESMQVSGPEESAAMIRAILSGQQGPPRDIVVLNAAAALWTAGKSYSPHQCAELAAAAIDSGAARDLLARLVNLTNDV